MQGLGFGKAVFLGLWLALLAMGACGDSTVINPAEPVRIEVSPSGSLELAAGDTLTLRVTLRNAASGAGVTYSVSDPRVAMVSAGGRITALAPGAATIGIVATQDTTVRTAVLLRVVDPLGTAPSTRPAAVAIESVQRASGLPVNPDSVTDNVFIRLNVERGTSSRLEVLLDSTIACSQTFTTPAAALAPGASSATAQVTLVCPVDTARYDTVSGSPTFLNGAAVLSARLVGANGTVLVRAGGLRLVLANVSRLLARVRAQRQATDGAGRSWFGGDVTLDALPVIFERGVRVTRSTFQVERANGPLLTLVDTSPPFAVVLRASSELAGVADSLRVNISSVTASGAEGPSVRTPELRYDAVPPQAGVLATRDWVGAETSFASLYTPAATADVGVGGVLARFLAGPADLDAAGLAAQGVEVSRGSDLRESGEGAYRLAARVCDALLNCTLQLSARTFGVDLTPPRIATTSIPTRAINPSGDLNIGVEDNRSGFSLRSVLASVRLLDADPATAECGPTVAGQTLPGRLVNGTCAPDSVPAVISLPRTQPGYYVYSLTPIDRAGNRGTTQQRTILIDAIAPRVTELTLPARLTGGAEVRLSAAARDNLDLVEGSFRLVYPRPGAATGFAIPFAPAVSIDAPFNDSLVVEAPVAATLPFVRTLTYTTAVVGPRPTVVADSVQVRVVDAAGNHARLSRPIVADSADGSNQAPFAAIVTAIPSVTNSVVCSQGCLAADITSTTFTLRVSGESGLRTPFDRVYLFRQGSDGEVVLLTSTTAFVANSVGTQTTFAYNLSYTPPAGVTGRQLLFAIGVRGGSGLKSEDVTTQFFTR